MRVAGVVAVFVFLVPCVVFLGAEQTFHLEFKSGRVSLVANDATVREILGEWARQRGATIVNPDAMADSRLTLELTDVPEREALHVVLRDAPGYILTSAAHPDGSSTFVRILILRTSGTSPPVLQTETARADTPPDDANGLPDPLAALLASAVAGPVDARQTRDDDAGDGEQLPAAIDAIMRAAKSAIPPKPVPAGPESPAPHRR
jgi:hypothetical protein